MKTKDECLNEVAEKHGYKNWEEYFGRWVSGYGGSNEDFENCWKEAMELYAQSMIKAVTAKDNVR